MKTKTKKITGILLMLVLLLGTFGIFAITVSAATEIVSYEHKTWNESTKTVSTTTKSATATVLTASDTKLGENGKTTYYVVNSTINTSSYLDVYGEVHLILKANYTTTGVIAITEGASLHLHKAVGAQTYSITSPELWIKGEGFYIHDATYQATDTRAGANIYIYTGDFVSYAGTINATIVKNMSTVSEKRSSVFIYGGEVKKYFDGSRLWGIGTDQSTNTPENGLESIEIYNANVNFESFDKSARAIIGGTVDRIVIYNSTVRTQIGSYKYAYGIVAYNEGATITIENSTVDAWGGCYAAGIGSDKADIIIKNSNVTARSGDIMDCKGTGFKCASLTVDGGYVTTETFSEEEGWTGVGYNVNDLTVLSGYVTLSRVSRSKMRIQEVLRYIRRTAHSFSWRTRNRCAPWMKTETSFIKEP